MIGRVINYVYWRVKSVVDNCDVRSHLVSREAQISAGCVVRPGVKVSGNCKIGRMSYLSGPGTVVHSGTIGRFCSIAMNVVIGLDEHDYSRVSTHPFLYSSKFGNFVGSRHSVQTKPPPIIEDDVWIGVGAIILRGVTIRKGAVIGAGSVVAKDVDPYSIVGGVPARVIRCRFSRQEIDFLIDLDWCSWSDSYIKDNISLFSSVARFRSLHEKTAQC